MIATLALPRAPRFSMRVPLRYRAPGDQAWSDGMAIDASRTGVLFETGCALKAVDTPVLVRLRLRGGPAGVEVQCVGRIARSETPPGDHAQMAATIESYEFVRAR